MTHTQHHPAPPRRYGWCRRQLNKHLVPAIDLAIVRIGEALAAR